MRIRSLILTFLMVAGVPWVASMLVLGPVFLPACAYSREGITAFVDPMFAGVSGAIWSIVAIPITAQIYSSSIVGRFKARRCVVCDYDLRAAPDKVCPECGQQFYRRWNGGGTNA